MKLNVGDKIKLKSYSQVVDMYRRGKLDNIGRSYPTNDNYIYGIDWNEYYHLPGFIGEIIEVNHFDFLVYFSNKNEDKEFDIPPILIQNISNINLPDELFEL